MMAKKDLSIQHEAKLVRMNSRPLHAPSDGDHEDRYNYCSNY